MRIKMKNKIKQKIEWHNVQHTKYIEDPEIAKDVSKEARKLMEWYHKGAIETLTELLEEL
jgi:hypothetical protein